MEKLTVAVIEQRSNNSFFRRVGNYLNDKLPPTIILGHELFRTPTEKVFYEVGDNGVSIKCRDIGDVADVVMEKCPYRAFVEWEISKGICRKENFSAFFQRPLNNKELLKFFEEHGKINGRPYF